MATNNNIFVIDDGTREVVFTNTFGEEICKIRIRSDYSILDRYQKLLDDVPKLIEPLGEIHIEDDGTSIDEKNWAIIKKIEQEIIEQINILFDTKDAGKLFTNRNVFSTVNGHFYVESVLKALGNVVGQGIKQENEITEKRIRKYTKDIKK